MHTSEAERGFTLIELQAVIALVAILAGMSVVLAQSALESARGDATMTQVASVLRFGRDSAIAQRRAVDVRFADGNPIELVRIDLPGGTTEIAQVVLEHGARFQLDPALPDTPDGFGRATPIDFDNAATVRFLPDGTLTDEAAIPINGTVFVAIPGQRLSARAVTVTGGSGRAQPYRWTGSQWEAR